MMADHMIDQQLRPRLIIDPLLLQVMAQVPRHLFVPQAYRNRAYDDCALPTSKGQTISQPYIVARMTEMLSVLPGDKVLEVGTGSGYQTAVLVGMGAKVVTIERHEHLSQIARQTLESLGMAGEVTFQVGDGTLGWPDLVPYDGILVTAAAPAVPTSLQNQLADGGRIVIPVGDEHKQRLMCVRHRDNQWIEKPGESCVFVPLIGREGWPAS
jgi:protein-L-isoaspartate(D-aspartate) O-methyltransferase